MQRIGRIRMLRPGAETAYDRYHQDVWPGVLVAIQRAGIRNYTIFRHGQWLFSYFELPDEIALADISTVFLSDAACCRWEVLMETLFMPAVESDDGGSWRIMKEVSHVDHASQHTM